MPKQNTSLLLTLSLIWILLSSCDQKYSFTLDSPKKIPNNKKVTVTVKEKNEQKIDSIQFKINSTLITSTTKTSSVLDASSLPFGKHALKAVVFYPNGTKVLTNTITNLPTTKPKIYTYEIINTYPHDPTAYTQGLEYYNGHLYESTGRKGKSSIRKVALKTGKVLQKVDLDRAYFGEGITIFKNKIYQLTWQAKKGFIYDLNSFEQIGTFDYQQSKQGWGFTHSDTELIKSDGTERIWFLNPENLQEKRYIEAYSTIGKSNELNEIEYINGKIYANIWRNESIAIINPDNGAIEGVVDLKSLSKQVRIKEKNDDVLNGIAYDKENDRIFVTGKHWNKLFEIRLIEKK